MPWRDVPLPGDQIEGRTTIPRWNHRRELHPFEEGYMEEDDGFFEEDEDVAALMQTMTNGALGKTLPSAALVRQVRDAVCYSYEGGSYPEDMPASVAGYLEPDGGLLKTLNVAVELLEERELAERDAGLVDRLAILLDDQAHGGGHVWWDDDDETFRREHGWESREAYRDSQRLMALEILRLITPRMMHVFAERCAGQLLPQFRDIVSKLHADG